MIVNKKSIFLFRLLSDLLLLNTAFIASAVIAQSWEILVDRNYMFFLLIGLNFLWIITSNSIDFYDDFYSRNFPIQFVNILKNTTTQVVASIVFIFLAREDLFTRYFIIYFALFLIAVICLRVILFRKGLKALRKKGRNIRNLLVIGDQKISENIKSMVSTNPDFGYNFVGTISGEDSIREINEANGKNFKLEKLLLSEKVEEVLIALTADSSHFLDGIIKICNRRAVKTHIIPDYFHYKSNRFQLSTFGDFPIITLRREPLDEVQKRILKRTFDIIFSLIIIIFILSWLYPIIFVLSKLTSPGPVFFVQDRIGTKNEKFNCYKFRTMNVEHGTEILTFKPVIKDDPRVTRFGKFLRKSNLDELPQFLNVLKGDMSAIGPRPHAIPYDRKYEKVVDEIRLRHNVKPGITGWAQVHGLRGDVEDENENWRRTEKRIQYDLWYIENWSFTLDIQIVLITIWQMIRGKTWAV
ncbi:MAG: undecaprenyl-phosphate glucose phosphotransferase [Ignavibacteriaceae bacterium]|nr:undecaprenyl-phosphate glucose phosphotransferase [Ignavibacteriaceae bacterium]